MALGRRAVLGLQLLVLAGGCAGGPPPSHYSTTPASSESGIFVAEGLASWYGPGFHGRKTASGERFDQKDLTCAHRTLPFGTRLKVTNLENGQELVVTVNDRGPYIRPRIIDLSKEAARLLDFIHRGTTRVRLEKLPPPEDVSGAIAGLVEGDTKVDSE